MIGFQSCPIVNVVLLLFGEYFMYARRRRGNRLLPLSDWP